MWGRYFCISPDNNIYVHLKMDRESTKEKIEERCQAFEHFVQLYLICSAVCNLYWYIRQWFWWHSMHESQCKQSRTDKSLFSFLYSTYNELLSERKCQPILKYIVSANDVYYWVVFLLVFISNAERILNFLFVWVHGEFNRKKFIFKFSTI